MRTFEDYILEQRLDEIGNSANPYPYKVKYKDRELIPFVEDKILTGVLAVSKFKTSTRANYFIDHIGMRKGTMGRLVEVGFGVFQKPDDYEKSAFDLTNAGLKEAFKVMSTVIACTREVLTTINKKHDYKFDYIMFSASQVGKGDGGKASEQREKLYKAFMSKQKDLGAIINKNGKVLAEIKPGFYK